MKNNLAKFKEGKSTLINSPSLSKIYGYPRPIRFWFDGYTKNGLFPLYTLFITDELMRDRKIRKSIHFEITSHILDNPNQYKV